MVGMGSIVSVGGSGGSGGGSGSNSGIQELNGLTTPSIALVGTSGIVVSPVFAGQINIGFTGDISQSGVLGVNGINVNQIGGDFVVDGIALSGLITPSGGIGSINGQIGPALEVGGTNGISVTVSAENVLTIDGAAISGLIPTLDGSGINAINGDFGPNIDLVGINGIEVNPLGNGQIQIDGAAVSGVSKFSQAFSGVTEATCVHNFGGFDIHTQVISTVGVTEVIIPDRIIMDDINTVRVLFNRAFTGSVIIIG